MTEGTTSRIGRQAVQGSFYSIGASIFTLILGFIRSLLLARFLLPEYFGIVALAMLFIDLANRLRSLGLDTGFIHRQNADQPFLKTYFTFRLGLDVLTAAVLLISAPIIKSYYPDLAQYGHVFSILVIANFFVGFAQIQEAFLKKALNFTSLVKIDIAASVVMTLIAPYLAWQGWGIWALVAEFASGVLVRVILTWGPLRQYLPRFGWDKTEGIWFWQFGKPLWVATNLNFFLDRFDDFWVGTALGGTPLGYYSKAYEFARYPRRVVANPLILVFTPIFSQLQDNRLQLSKAFYRSTYLIVRAGFLIAGTFALVIPEFIFFVIGDQWLPMLWTFRLMLIYTILDPVILLINNLLPAVGKSEIVQTVSLVQTIFFIPAVIIGATLGGINGVALAANGMLLLGLWRYNRPLRTVVDFSAFKLLLQPTLAMIVAWSAGFSIEILVSGSFIFILVLKIVVFLTIFGLFLLLLERDDYTQGIRWIWQIIQTRRRRNLKSE